MNKFMEAMEKHLVPVAAKIGSQRYLVAIRDAFIVSMPLMIFGSIGTLINTLPIKSYQNFMNNTFGEELWKSFGNAMNAGTFSILTLLVVFAIGYNIAKSYKEDALASAIISTSAYFVIGGATGLNSKGLFIGIIVAILATEIFLHLMRNKKLRITLPEGVPMAVSRSFESLFPAILTLTVFAAFALCFKAFGIEDLIESFYGTIQKPFMGLTNNVFAAVIISFFIQLLWFFGLHGGNILSPFMETINTPAIDANVTALAAGQAAPYIVNKPFMTAFVHLGGAGATIGLVIAILLVARRDKMLNTIASLSLAPGIFNINEPMVFGLPIVLNPILFIPYVLGPSILAIIAYYATSFGFVPAATIVIPWNAPPIIGAVLATQSWQGGVIATLNLLLSILIYIPFVRMLSAQNKKMEQ